MKSIELTEEHKSKLLEMCEVLFSEYNFNKQFHGNEQYINFTGGKEIENTEYDEFEIDECIHWFEFCMTHLAKKLLVMYDFTIYQTTGNFMYQHPIDYLYEKFKQLNL